MECFRCGERLGEGDRCPGCGVNVKVYKKIIHLSNFYYNEGLARAKVRDLTGAEDSLKKSLYFNKKHIAARNLLGLVYFEMGETVSALSEWVISKNYRTEHNAAEKYLRELQKNPAQLDSINQTIKKFNQAITHCQQGNEDMAVIQLKKVISMNSKMVRAHQLLALIYIKQGKYDYAAKCLRQVEKIDAGNTTTLRYKQEIQERMQEGTKKGKKENRIAYQSGNETIIQPTHSIRDTSVVSYVVTMLICVAIGVAITLYLIVPNIKHNAIRDSKAELNEANSSVTTKEQTITSLKEEVKNMKKKVTDAEKNAASANEKIQSYSKVIEAYAAYLREDREAAAAALQGVKPEDLDETTRNLYNTTNEQITTSMMGMLYDEGVKAYNTRDYQTAVTDLQQVVNVDETYGEGYAVYYLAQSLRITQDMEYALAYYQRVVELYPGTIRAKTAQNYINENPNITPAQISGSQDSSEGSQASEPSDETAQ